MCVYALNGTSELISLLPVTNVQIVISGKPVHDIPEGASKGTTESHVEG